MSAADYPVGVSLLICLVVGMATSRPKGGLYGALTGALMFSTYRLINTGGASLFAPWGALIVVDCVSGAWWGFIWGWIGSLMAPNEYSTPEPPPIVYAPPPPMVHPQQQWKSEFGCEEPRDVAPTEAPWHRKSTQCDEVVQKDRPPGSGIPVVLDSTIVSLLRTAEEELKVAPNKALPLVSLQLKNTILGLTIVWQYREQYGEAELDASKAEQFLNHRLESAQVRVTDAGYMGKDGIGNMLFTLNR